MGVCSSDSGRGHRLGRTSASTGLTSPRRANRRWPCTSCVRRYAGLNVASASKSPAGVAAVVRVPPLPLSRSCREAPSTTPSRGSVRSMTARPSSHEPSTGSCAPSPPPDEPRCGFTHQASSHARTVQDSRSDGRGQPTCLRMRAQLEWTRTWNAAGGNQVGYYGMDVPSWCGQPRPRGHRVPLPRTPRRSARSRGDTPYVHRQ